MKHKILLLENINPDAKKYFEKKKFQVEYIKGVLSKKELIKKIKNVDALGIRSKTEIDKDIAFAAKRLKVISVYGIGVNKVDLESCAKAGISVFNAPYSSTRSVAELTIGFVISLLRKIGDNNNKLHQGIWEKSAQGCFEIKGKTLGIIGYGNIGTQVSVLASALGMNVIYYDPMEKMPLGNAEKISKMEDIFKKADIISVHVGEPDLVKDKHLKLMKKGSYIINTSRGYAIDAKALVKHLKNGHLNGAALDVFPEEPAANGDEFKNQFQKLPNVILTPHIGASTEEAQRDIALTTSEKIFNYLTEGSTLGSVNLPQVMLTKKNGGQRFVYIHKNVPGVMSKLNGIIAERGINIDGQHLQTKGVVGYAVIDINRKLKPQSIKAIEAIKASIKVISL